MNRILVSVLNYNLVKKLLSDSEQILSEYGIASFTRAVAWFVWFRTFRRIMPEPTQVFTIDDVRFTNGGQYPVKIGDKMINWNASYNGYYFPKSYAEHGEIIAHQIFTRRSDRVCIIGGGQAFTTVHAARQVGGGRCGDGVRRWADRIACSRSGPTE